jgi:Zn-dependent protease
MKIGKHCPQISLTTQQSSGNVPSNPDPTGHRAGHWLGFSNMPRNFDLIATSFEVMKFFVPFLFALCFHEFAHGWVARLRGDRTAEIMGRLTLNPLAHADPIGTVVLPIMAVVTQVPFFGWAKPVPVDERNLKNPRADMFWIAAAGPLSNLLLALIGAVVTGLFVRFYATAIYTGEQGPLQILEVMKIFITINVFLAVFNMIPLHPLDGAKVLARFLPEEINRKLEDMQMYSGILLLLLFVTGMIGFIAGPARWIGSFFIALANQVATT